MENRKYCLEPPEVSSGNPKTKINPVNRKRVETILKSCLNFQFFFSIIKKDDSVGFGTLSGKNRVINFSIFSKCSTDKLSQIVSLNYPQKKFEK